MEIHMKYFSHYEVVTFEANGLKTSFKLIGPKRLNKP